LLRVGEQFNVVCAVELALQTLKAKGYLTLLGAAGLASGARAFTSWPQSWSGIWKEESIPSVGSLMTAISGSRLETVDAGRKILYQSCRWWLI
jgi:hypothetical protein